MRLRDLTFLMNPGQPFDRLEIEWKGELFVFTYRKGLAVVEVVNGYDLGQAARRLTELTMADDPGFASLSEYGRGITAKALERAHRQLLTQLTGD